MNIIIFLIFLGFVRSYEFNHPTTIITFRWIIFQECLSSCKLIVVDKDTNETMNFLPNTDYLSCQYIGNYQWNIICNNDSNCTVDENILSKNPQVILYATKQIGTFNVDNYTNNLIVINIPFCSNIKDGDCLIVEYSKDMDIHLPLLQYYGKNYFDCNSTKLNTTDQIIPFSKSIKHYNIGNGNFNEIFYSTKLRLGCYSDKYYNIDSIANNDNYYFNLRSLGAKITYFIGNIQDFNVSTNKSVNDQSTNENKYEILFWIFFGLSLILAVSLALYIRLHHHYADYSRILINDINTDDDYSNGDDNL